MDASLEKDHQSEGECGTAHKETSQIKSEIEGSDDGYEEKEVYIDCSIDDRYCPWKEDPLKIENVKVEGHELKMEIVTNNYQPDVKDWFKFEQNYEVDLNESENNVVIHKTNATEVNTADASLDNVSEESNALSEEISLSKERRVDWNMGVHQISQPATYYSAADMANNVLKKHYSNNSKTELSGKCDINSGGNSDNSEISLRSRRDTDKDLQLFNKNVERTGKKVCSYCNKTFKLFSKLKAHFVKHTKDQPFSCSVCDKSFTQHSDLKIHMHSHKEEKPHYCSVCEKSFTQSANLKRHMLIHTGEKPHSCSVCEKSFTQSVNLKSHMRIHTREKPYSCSVCEKSFTRADLLKIHMRVHSREKPHSCSVCEKSFTQAGPLISHMRLHTGEKPYSCSICLKSFIKFSNLKSHMRIHTGEKPFLCTVCKKSFTQSGHLKTHMCIHSGEKPYSCSVCEKSFTRGDLLKIHMRVHSGEKPYSCSVCEKSFIKFSNLKRHMRIHPEEKPFL